LERREEDVRARRAQSPIGLKEKVGIPVELALASTAASLWQRHTISRGRVHLGPSRVAWVFFAWERRITFLSCTIRIDPNAKTKRPPQAAAASRATASGNVAERKTKLTRVLCRFWKMKMRMKARRTRAGITPFHARLTRVERGSLGTGTGAGRPVARFLSSGMSDNEGTCAPVVSGGCEIAAWARTGPSILPRLTGVTFTQ
jgi:hypothetical protein